MGSSGFVFLNATGTPQLSLSDSKLMRSHITRSNFANRRQQIESGTLKQRTKKSEVARKSARVLTQSALPLDPQYLPLTRPPKDPYHYARFLSRFWSLVFLDGSSYPRNPSEEGWIQLVASESALAEISMAIGIRYWSPDASCQEKAVAHSSKAANVIVQRIRSETAHTGAVLGAVLSMAIGERLVHNEFIWNIHIDGLANLISERHSQGETSVPPMICAFLTLDSTNAVFGFSLVYHKKVTDAIRSYGSLPICTVADICENLIQLRESIDGAHEPCSKSEAQSREIEKIWNNLLSQAQALQQESDQLVKATAQATELILYLSWSPSFGINLTLLANELKETWCQFPFRPCLFMELTSCQLMLGAIAADEGSETRAWFIARLRIAVQALKSRGWVRPLDILEKVHTSNSRLMSRIRALWEELDF